MAAPVRGLWDLYCLWVPKQALCKVNNHTPHKMLTDRLPETILLLSASVNRQIRQWVLKAGQDQGPVFSSK